MHICTNNKKNTKIKHIKWEIRASLHIENYSWSNENRKKKKSIIHIRIRLTITLQVIYSYFRAFTRIKIWFEHIIIYTYVHEVHLGWLSVRMLCLNTKCIKRTMLSRENQTRESDPSSTFPIKIHRNNRCFKSLKYFQALPRWFNNGQIKYSTLHRIALHCYRSPQNYLSYYLCAPNSEAEIRYFPISYHCKTTNFLHYYRFELVKHKTKLKLKLKLVKHKIILFEQKRNRFFNKYNNQNNSFWKKNACNFSPPQKKIWWMQTAEMPWFAYNGLRKNAFYHITPHQLTVLHYRFG